MNATTKPRGHSLDDIGEAESPEVYIPNPRRKQSKTGKIKASFFLTADMHDELIEVCRQHKISQQQFFEVAYDLYMRALGKPGLEKSE